MSGFFEPGRGEDVDYPAGRHRPRDDLPDRVVEVLLGLALAGSALCQHRPDRLEERHVVPNADRLVAGDGERERLARVRVTAPQEPVLAVRPARGCAPGPRAAAPRRSSGVPRDPLRPVEAVEEPAADLVLLQHHGDRFLLVDRGLARAAALRVGRERLLQLVGEPQVVDDQPARLVRNTRFTRAMACISPWPRIGLSTYIVCRLGASKPVSHMSRTMTT